MNIIFDITIQNTENNKRFGFYRKEFESNIVPIPGVSIEDSCWSGNPKIPTNITISYDENYCLVNFDSIDKENEDYCKKMEDYMLENGWKKPGK